MPSPRHPHADVILLARARGDRIDRRGVGQRLALRHDRGGRVLDQHEPAVQPALRDEERRKPARGGRVQQAVKTAVADRGERHERERQCVEGDRDRHPVEVPAAPDVVVLDEHDRVVAHAVRLDREHVTNVPAGVARGAVHLRRAPERVGILDLMWRIPVRLADRRSGQERAQVRRARGLPRMGTQRLEPLVEGRVGAERGLDRHRCDDVGRPRERLRPGEREHPDREHALRPVHQREPFLGFERERRQRLVRQHVAGGHRCRAVVGRQQAPEPDQREREAGERREIAGSPERSLLRDRRDHVAVQHLDHAIDHDLPHAGMAEREDVCAEQQHRARLLPRQRRSDGGRVRGHDAVLERGGLLGRDRDVRERAEAGRHAVHPTAVGDGPLHHRARGADPFAGGARERHVRAARHRDHVLERQRLAHRYRHGGKATRH